MTPRRFLAETRAAVAIEFALVAPALLMLIVGVFEVASLVLASWSLDSAAFQAARYGVIGAGATDEARTAHINEIVASRSFGVINIEDISVETRVFTDIETMTTAEGPADGTPGPGGPDDMVLYFVEGAWHPMTPFFAAIMDPVSLKTRVPVMNEPE